MEAPFLPPIEPTDNPVPTQNKKKQARKTLVLWVLLIIMFIAIYQFFSPPPHQHQHHSPPPPSPGWSPFWSFMPALFTAGVFIFWLRWTFRGGTKLNQALEPGNLALADGDPARAVEIFRVVEKRYEKQATYAAAVRLSLAMALLDAGDSQGAIDTLVRAEKGAGLLYGSDVRVSAAVHLAHLYGLTGELDAAEKWIADTRRRLQRQTSHRIWSGAQLCVCEAIVACRRGRLDEAVKLLERNWRRLQHSLTVVQIREAWLLRAFAASGQTRADAQSWLVLLRSARGELDYVGRGWPEMQVFLTANDLSRPIN
jgi:hypothetical protein